MSLTFFFQARAAVRHNSSDERLWDSSAPSCFGGMFSLLLRDVYWRAERVSHVERVESCQNHATSKDWIKSFVASLPKSCSFSRRFILLKTQAFLKFQEIDSGALSQLVDFLYTAEIRVTEENVQVWKIRTFIHLRHRLVLICVVCVVIAGASSCCEHAATGWSARRVLRFSSSATPSFKLPRHQGLRRLARLPGAAHVRTSVHGAAFQVHNSSLYWTI